MSFSALETDFMADNGTYPFPTPDWLISNTSYVAAETDLYYKSRQGT